MVMSHSKAKNLLTFYNFFNVEMVKKIPMDKFLHLGQPQTWVFFKSFSPINEYCPYIIRIKNIESFIKLNTLLFLIILVRIKKHTL